MYSFDSFNRSFQMAQSMFFIVFFLLLGIIIYSIVVSARKAAKNSSSPVLTVDSSVIAKRTHHHEDFTTYYATFQVDSGDRFELCIDGEQYGLLAEGDYGKLTFQGERFIEFERVNF